MNRRCLIVIGILLTMFILSAGCGKFAHIFHRSPQIKVITFNIRYGTAGDGENSWDSRKEMVVSLLKQENPDIICLQEALRFQLDFIETNMSDFREIGVGREDGDTLGEYSAILYRSDKFTEGKNETFWLSDTDTFPASITWGNACTRICTYAELYFTGAKDSFFVFNTHLDHISEYSRQKSVVSIITKMRGVNEGGAFILTGDFNAGEQSPEIKLLKGECSLVFEDSIRLENKDFILQDSFRSLHPSEKYAGTYHAFTGDSTGEKIDYIFISSRWRTTEARILRNSYNGLYPSDHFPVEAILKLTN